MSDETPAGEVEVTIALRYEVAPTPDAYPGCETIADAAAYDQASFDDGRIGPEDLIGWAQNESITVEFREASTGGAKPDPWNEAVDWLLNTPLEPEDRAGFDLIAEGICTRAEVDAMSGDERYRAQAKAEEAGR
jgi:hypothetical protein